MQVVVNKKVLEKMIEEVVNEVSSFHSVRIDEIPAKDDEAPIKPSEQMATQLSTDKPPVDDENYKPVNTSQLTKASAAIAEKVPQDRVQKFYKQLKDLAQSAQDEKKEEQLAEDKIRQIVEYVTGKKISEAKGTRIDPDDEAKLSKDIADANAFTDAGKRSDIEYALSAPELRKKTAPGSIDSFLKLHLTGNRGALEQMFNQIEKKSGVIIKRLRDLMPIKAELLAPGGIILKRDNRGSPILMLTAGGVSYDVTGLGVNEIVIHLTDEEIEAAARRVIEFVFDIVAEKFTTEHFIGPSRRAGTKEGLLKDEAKDIAISVLTQAGNQLPESSKILIDELDQFVESQQDFIKNSLSDTNRTSRFEFKDIIPTGRVSVTIDYSNIPELSKFPQKVRDFTEMKDTKYGFILGEFIDTVEYFKVYIKHYLDEEFSKLEQKALKKPRSKSFTSTGDGRNLASDLLRRLGGRYASASPEQVYQYTRDMAMQAAEEDESLTSKDLDDIQMDALKKIGVLDPDRLDMRRQLIDAFYENFFSPAILIASQNFDDSTKINKDFKAKAQEMMTTLDGEGSDIIFDIYTDLLKEFGEIPSNNQFIKSYEKIVKLPDYRAYVEKLGGTSRSDVFERSGKAYFDKDTTFIFNLFTAANYAKSVKNDPRLADILAGREDTDDKFDVAISFGKDARIAIQDEDNPIRKKAIKKITELIASSLGVQPKKDKKLKEALALRSMIRHALRD
jgi:hypothetical protein